MKKRIFPILLLCFLLLGPAYLGLTCSCGSEDDPSTGSGQADDNEEAPFDATSPDDDSRNQDDDAGDDDSRSDDDTAFPGDCPEGFPAEPLCVDTVVIGGLEWTRCDNGEDINYFCAVRYVESLTLSGFFDWRLPGTGELLELYDPENEQMTECGIRAGIVEPFDLSCDLIWSNRLYADGVGQAFYFRSGLLCADGLDHDASEGVRVLAVRGRIVHKKTGHSPSI